MDSSEFIEALKDIVSRFHRQDHPYFRAWASGELPLEAVQAYVQQHHYLASRVLPMFAIASGLTDSADVRDFLTANLREEEAPDQAHDDLLLDLGESLGLDRNLARHGPLLPTTEATIDFLFSILIHQGPVHFIAAACVGLESQGPAMYRSVIPAMREHYGLVDEQMVFLTLHVEADEEHGDGAIRLLSRHAVNDDLQRALLLTAERGARKGLFHLDGIWLQYVRGYSFTAAAPDPILIVSPH